MAQQERARRTYEAVLDAAAREFSAHGYANTNLGHVAQSTGVTKGALYGHFASKEELAAALVQHLDDAWKLIEDGVGETPDSPVATLKNVTCALVARLHRDIRVNAALRLLLEEAQSTKRTPAFVSDVERTLLRLVVQAQQQGEMDSDYPPEPVAQLMTTVIFGAHYLGSVREELDLITRVRSSWDVLLPALGARWVS
ncbi:MULTISPECIES: TetR/AcrR family transcriptional regulator [Streptomycetaceae]|uniref:TetR/AcrR family transcriptional regulator n=1 Tax=Streptomycetaceae TaxID=2062 RepID=UPI0009980D0B|nr:MULTISPECIES: TetR/AcrR family transcriptional regulator [Streptomycetaceae]MCU7827391.1 TetR/AcrR family transcriptional regulator [Kitasatospora sp. DSM 101779]